MHTSLTNPDPVLLTQQEVLRETPQTDITEFFHAGAPASSHSIMGPPKHLDSAGTTIMVSVGDSIPTTGDNDEDLTRAPTLGGQQAGPKASSSSNCDRVIQASSGLYSQWAGHCSYRDSGYH
ncbi:hypothetical protein NDU88_002063 [Pleurodeles waltl]|uniref:Uncharacterized protein n=1 Tax=Pleurodeles waltl TaxID=8319 RepID=A0AAV7MUK6_PLEWA|nr:hypothetical protein NDU88_002063 [Pleurodeles waltl]